MNIAATYGRSLYALAIGLFCGRWMLAALGVTDFGLLGVVGGMVAFVSFLNRILASGIGRYYAVSVGESRADPERGLEKCREWFTTAVLVHTVLPVVLMSVGYPVGEWAVRHFLTIPPDRLAPCIWVWRFTCVSCLVTMATGPYTAMYYAKQEIAELTVYSFITSTLNFFFMHYAVHHPGDWLARVAFWNCLLSATPPLVIAFRAVCKYEECRFKRAYVKCWGNIRSMLSYSGWLSIGTLADLMSIQGMNVLVNKYFGPAANAAQSVSHNLSGHCTALSGSLLGAFWPAVMNAYGARDFVQMRKMAYLVCKLAPILIMVFAIPLALEIDEVLLLWLKNPPASAAGLCVLALLVLVMDRATHGFAMTVHATGDIAKYQSVVGGAFLFALPLAWVLFARGCSVYALGYALLVSRGACTVARIFMAREKTGLSFKAWITGVMLPLLAVAAFSVAFGLIPRISMKPSFLRVFTTSIASIGAMSISCWFVVMSRDDRLLVLRAAKRIIQKQAPGSSTV